MDSNCPFCSAKLSKERILYEEKLVFVILSDPRLMEGHTLVIPTRHVSSLAELTEDERRKLFHVAIRFQEKLKKLYPGGGCDLSQHDRPFMPTTKLTIPGHIHIHLRPRTWQDGYYERVLMHETGMFGELTRAEMKKFRKLLGE